jgi:hypothetical protein
VSKNPDLIPIHQWTDGNGEVLVVRCLSLDGKSYGGFQNPLEVGALLKSPETWDVAWGPQPDEWRGGGIRDQKCGGGIHGWPWAIGLGDGKGPDWRGLWQVYGVKPDDVIGDVEGVKCKFVGDGILRYSGDWHGASMFVLKGQMAWAFHNSQGSASNSGDSGSASNSGYSGSASNSGYSGSASNSGYRGSASNSGDSGSAETTFAGTGAMVTGVYGRAKAAEFGCISLAWWNEKKQRVEMRTALTGSGKDSLKADIWYELNARGQFKEVKE